MKNIGLKSWFGLTAFIIAEIVYGLTLEPSNSYWDCSEFITCANKLEVGHAPGAPLFMLLGRFFSLFAFGNPAKVAVMVNLLSATASALTILFLFSIQVWFLQKIVAGKKQVEDIPRSKSLLIYFISLFGALAFAFTDSFWFSAVEAEVYATSSLLSVIVFWAILKWEQAPSNEQNKWIFLIFFLLGLSVGVHLLNLLTLPALVLVFYYKKYPFSYKGLVVALAISFILLLLFVFGIIPWVAKLAAWADLFFVNTLSLPVYTGAIAFMICLATALYYLIRFANKKKRHVLRLITLSLVFWLVGYSSFIVLVIRSGADTFVDINNVENLFGLVDYLNREQYPTRPLVKGNSFNSPILGQEKRYTYKLYDGEYLKDELNPDYLFDEKTLSYFPRMASLDPKHANYYKKWVEIRGRKVWVNDGAGGKKAITVPTLSDNLRFFIRYQLGYMYFRYFMWNFAGRQNDTQGHGGLLNGNWISGISFFDNVRLGDQKSIPPIYKKQKTRNTYYFLPLILGLVGMLYHYKKNKKGFSVLLLFFLMTGVAIVVYLNEIPITPRERDYAFVGSFMAFCVWLGIGAFALIESVRKFLDRSIWQAMIGLLLAVAIPGNMLVQNWDDHDRSGRSVAHDFAENILKTLGPNAVFFTNGDNDTYPIWYMQEVEGVRTDVRHVLQTFMPIEWYANQLEQPFSDKNGLELSFKGKELLMSKNNYFPVIERTKEAQELQQVIAFLKSGDKRAKVKLSNGEMVNYMPTTHLKLKVDAAGLKSSCKYLKDYNGNIPGEIDFTLKGKYLTREQVLMLDLLAQNAWKRPMYFMSPNALDNIGLGDYLHPVGNVYCLLPFPKRLPYPITQNMALHQYHLIKDVYKWGGIQSGNVFLDATTKNEIQSFRYPLMFARVARQLSNIGEQTKAIDLLDECMEVLPVEKVGYSVYISKITEMYYQLGEKDKGDKLSEKCLKELSGIFEYADKNQANGVQGNWNEDLGMAMYTAIEILNVMTLHTQKNGEPYKTELQKYYSKYFINAAG